MNTVFQLYWRQARIMPNPPPGTTAIQYAWSFHFLYGKQQMYMYADLHRSWFIYYKKYSRTNALIHFYYSTIFYDAVHYHSAESIRIYAVSFLNEIVRKRTNERLYKIRVSDLRNNRSLTSQIIQITSSTGRHFHVFSTVRFLFIFHRSNLVTMNIRIYKLFYEFTCIKIFNNIYKKCLPYITISVDTCQRCICIIFTIIVEIRFTIIIINKNDNKSDLDYI
jgi:hypothetical protein